jgi:hypothetical protein
MPFDLLRVQGAWVFSYPDAFNLHKPVKQKLGDGYVMAFIKQLEEFYNPGRLWMINGFDVLREGIEKKLIICEMAYRLLSGNVQFSQCNFISKEVYGNMMSGGSFKRRFYYPNFYLPLLVLKEKGVVRDVHGRIFVDVKKLSAFKKRYKL